MTDRIEQARLAGLAAIARRNEAGHAPFPDVDDLRRYAGERKLAEIAGPMGVWNGARWPDRAGSRWLVPVGGGGYAPLARAKPAPGIRTGVKTMVARRFLTSDDLAARRKEDDEKFFNQILIEEARAISGIRDDVPIEPLSEKGTPVAPDPSPTSSSTDLGSQMALPRRTVGGYAAAKPAWGADVAPPVSCPRNLQIGPRSPHRLPCRAGTIAGLDVSEVVTPANSSSTTFASFSASRPF